MKITKSLSCISLFLFFNTNAVMTWEVYETLKILRTMDHSNKPRIFQKIERANCVVIKDKISYKIAVAKFSDLTATYDPLLDDIMVSTLSYDTQTTGFDKRIFAFLAQEYRAQEERENKH